MHVQTYKPNLRRRPLNAAENVENWSSLEGSTTPEILVTTRPPHTEETRGSSHGEGNSGL